MLDSSKYVLNSGKPTAIQMADVLMFEAANKYIDVLYWDAAERIYRSKTVEWSLNKILADHSDEFISVFRNTIVRKTSIHKLYNDNLGQWYAEVCGNDKKAFALKVSRRQKPTINRLLKARNADAAA